MLTKFAYFCTALPAPALVHNLHMATLLNDSEIAKLFGTVIQGGDKESIRPNSYVLRLGSAGEFINTGKIFELGNTEVGTTKKGIRVQPGHSVGVTAFETIDFRRESVQKIYPEHDLHAIISPTTDLSREGIVAPTTQIDAGYHGTLNWTLTNTSSDERRFVHKERIFRLTIFKLEKDERPTNVYSGDYQGQTGYIRSQRRGAPVGMKEGEWEDGQAKGSPEDLLDNLLKSGYPWHVLGQRLKLIDQQFKSVTNEYADIREAIERLTGDVYGIRDHQGQLSETVRTAVREEANQLQNRWLIGSGSIVIATIGLGLSVTSNPSALAFLGGKYGIFVGLALIAMGAVALTLLSRSRPSK
jgi:deoxycytidine triphosphate deaminase